jgi:phosphatidylinositol phospholipase C delta
LNAGCQLVALNVQTKDSHLAVYDSLFRENGNTDFVLKPATLLNSEVPANNKKRISIKVIKGKNLTTSKKLIDTYVCLRIEGVKDDVKKNNTKTAVTADGKNPEWNQTLQFDVTRSELDFLVIKVKKKTNTWASKMTLLELTLYQLQTLQKAYKLFHLRTHF